MTAPGFPSVTLADWRALVDRELAGVPFETALLRQALDGVPLEPLYAERPPHLPVLDASPEPFRICMRHDADAGAEAWSEDLDDGADALWVPMAAVPDALRARALFVLEPGDLIPRDAAQRAVSAAGRFVLALDPLSAWTRGGAPVTTRDLHALTPAVEIVGGRGPAIVASSVVYHDAGADGADEIACVLASGVCYLATLLEAGIPAARAAEAIALQVAVGRETFLELCKLRALRVCWDKLLVAVGAAGAPRALVHAVCSARTVTVRDPWVNMLRVTTQVFAAVLGGADLVTPRAFDEALGAPSPLGRRVARNTGLVLREESALGRVADPAGGSYAFETLTDALARAGWRRFQEIEREGGLVAALASGRLAAQVAAKARQRVEQVARGQWPIVGVSVFADLDEALPRPASVTSRQPADTPFPLRPEAEPGAPS